MARLVGRLSGSSQTGDLAALLRAYAAALVPWARRTAWRMLRDIDDSTERTWNQLSEEIAFHLKREVSSGPIRDRLVSLLDEQVNGIVSIPLRAAERVEKLALEAVTEGKRFGELAQALSTTGEVSQSNATRLARTSVSGAATALMQARAEQAGSVAYVWETARDNDVRESHRKMQGQVVRWDDPPTIDGYTAHAGQFANCRCWPRPILSLE